MVSSTVSIFAKLAISTVTVLAAVNGVPLAILTKFPTSTIVILACLNNDTLANFANSSILTFGVRSAGNTFLILTDFSSLTFTANIAAFTGGSPLSICAHVSTFANSGIVAALIGLSPLSICAHFPTQTYSGIVAAIVGGCPLAIYAHFPAFTFSDFNPMTILANLPIFASIICAGDTFPSIAMFPIITILVRSAGHTATPLASNHLLANLSIVAPSHGPLHAVIYATFGTRVGSCVIVIAWRQGYFHVLTGV